MVGAAVVAADVVAVVADAVGGGDVVADVVADASFLKLHLSVQNHFHISFLLSTA